MNFTAIRSKLAVLPAKYGAAAFITVQFLGTITYILILALLIVSNVDLSSVVEWFGITSFSDMSNTFYGRAAAAFVLNRILSPVRLILCVWIVPRVAVWLNPIVEKFYERWNGKKNE